MLAINAEDVPHMVFSTVNCAQSSRSLREYNILYWEKTRMQKGPESFCGPQIVHVCSTIKGSSHKEVHFIANEDAGNLLLMIVQLFHVYPGVRRRARFN
jgi:hypothetical protein